MSAQNPSPNHRPAGKFRSTLLLMALFMLLGNLPEMVVRLKLPEGYTFTGVFVNVDDASVYFSAMRQGGESNWLFTPQFSPENMPSHIAYLPYLIFGKLQTFFGGSEFIWYWLLRQISILFVFWGLRFLLQTVFPDKPRLQATAWMLLLFGSGIGWLVFPLTGLKPSITPDILLPEWSLMTAFLSAPHFSLGIGSQAFFFGLVLKVFSNVRKIQDHIGLACLSILLGLVFPFLIPVNGLVIILLFVHKMVRERTIPWKIIANTTISCLPLLFFLAYYGLMLPRDPVWAVSLIQTNQITPPSLVGIFVGSGFLLVLFLLTLPRWFKSDEIPTLLPLWFIVNLVSLYLPVSFSGRLVLGLTIPLTLLAAYGLEECFLPWLERQISARLDPRSIQHKLSSARRTAILLTLPSTLIFIGLLLANGAQTMPEYPLYYQQAEIEAIRWLGLHTTEDDLVFASYPISNIIPRASNAHVFAGHLNLTLDLSAKLPLLHQFWDPNTSHEWREQFIEEMGVTYIYQGRFETELSIYQIPLPGEIVYQENGITIYDLHEKP